MQDPTFARPSDQPRPWAVLLRTVFAAAAAIGVGLGITLFLPESDELGAEAVRLLVLFSVPALVMGGFAVLFASRAPEGVRQRLRVVRPQLPRFALLLLVPATWAMWLLAIPLAFLGMWLFDASPEDLAFSKHFAGLPAHWALVLVAAGAVFPAVGEELLFRGYLQAGLLRWWRPVLSLALTAAMFALAHLPPARVFAVLPLAAWFGFLAFRSGSVLPGIACHVLQNLSGLSVASFGIPPSPAVVIAIGAAFLAGVACFVAFLVLLLRSSRPSLSAPGPAPASGQLHRLT